MPLTMPTADGKDLKQVRLGDILIEAALATPTQMGMHGPQHVTPTAAQTVARYRLATRVHDAMESGDTETAFSIEQVALLRDHVPLLETQRGFGAHVLGAALLAICPDDFPVKSDA
ncbi:MAG: hypothetical protein ACRCTG_15435 [Aestuariivirga sp.]